MNLTSYERYEIQAVAFRIMTGHMAPGKDASFESYPAPWDERHDAWKEWIATNGECIQSMLRGIQSILETSESWWWK